MHKGCTSLYALSVNYLKMCTACALQLSKDLKCPSGAQAYAQKYISGYSAQDLLPVSVQASFQVRTQDSDVKHHIGKEAKRLAWKEALLKLG